MTRRIIRGAVIVAALWGALWLAGQIGSSDLDRARQIEHQLTHLPGD